MKPDYCTFILFYFFPKTFIFFVSAYVFHLNFVQVKEGKRSAMTYCGLIFLFFFTSQKTTNIAFFSSFFFFFFYPLYIYPIYNNQFKTRSPGKTLLMWAGGQGGGTSMGSVHIRKLKTYIRLSIIPHSYAH